MLASTELRKFHDLLDTALDLTPAEREQWLDALAKTDAGITPRLRQLLQLRGLEETDRFLERGPGFTGLAPQRSRSTFTAGDVVGPYRLLRELGHGGMGEVWLAERADGHLKRQLALKLPIAMARRDVLVQRFARERDILGALAHPHIARLYDAGLSADGQPYLGMEFVAGLPITEYCAQHRLDVRARLHLLRQVLDAVQFAHANLVLHRDLKPANVLVTEQGQAMLLDFGIAKLLDADLAEAGASELTQVGGQVLTPDYASPEQITGGAVSIATDVYAIGLLMYELLAGARPFEPRSTFAAAVAFAQRRGEPIAPSLRVLQHHPAPDGASAAQRGAARQLAARLKGDLDTITLKALKPEPAERYQTVHALALDLDRTLKNEPIEARADSALYRIHKFVRRHSKVVLAGALSAGVVIALTVTASIQANLARVEAQRAQVVQSFLGSIFAEAEPLAATEGREVTGKDILATGVTRAHEDFASEPDIQGRMLAAIGGIYMRLGDDTLATATLDEAIRLLEAHADPADAALNEARMHMANLRHEANDVAAARTLALKAIDACRGDHKSCHMVRAMGHHTLAALHHQRGEAEAALAEALTALHEFEASHGAGHPRLAQPLGDLALLQKGAGRLKDAAATMTHALAIAQKDRRAFSSTVNQLRRHQASIQIDLGHFAAALATMETTPVPQVEGTYFIGAHYKTLAEAYLGQGRLADARAAIAHGVDAMRDDKDDLAMAALIATRARIEAVGGSPGQAMADIERVLAVFGARGLGAENVRVLRARSIQAEVQLRSGAVAQAQAQLTQTLQTLQRALPAMSLEQAQVLSLLGAARLQQGDPQGASDAHREARRLLVRESPPDSLHLARNAFAIALCDALARPDAAATRDLMDRATELTARLPADSAFVPQIARMTAAAAASPEVARTSALNF